MSRTSGRSAGFSDEGSGVTLGDKKQTAVIIGAGPAGLTAALELCRQTDIQPIVLEASDRIGGISCTVRYNGNRIDIGGHRFFSKSDRVMDWWTELMPISDSGQNDEFAINYRNTERKVSNANAKNDGQARGPIPIRDPDRVMLVRPRKSRIYFMRSFFDYPLSLSLDTLRRLGPVRTVRILLSYLKAQATPRKPENTLEDFLINRFGRELYFTFFKSYTEKVWGVPCDKISAAWGAQRIKGLSLLSAVGHFVKKLLSLARGKKKNDIRQKESETSLIEQFLYPKYGPGQLWEHVAKMIEASGGEVRLGCRVETLHVERAGDGSFRMVSATARTPEGRELCIDGDYFFSTMPIRELMRSMNLPVPKHIQAISDGLMYRDFITVGLLVDRLLLTEPDGSMIKDTWIYVQEPDVLVGRIQIFNNWSPYLVSDPSKVWIGLEYFCYDTDPLGTRAMKRLQNLRSAKSRESVFCEPRKSATHAYSGFRRLTQLTLEPMIASMRLSSIWSFTRTSSLWAETACISTTIRTTRC